MKDVMIYECKYFTVSEIIRTYMQRYLDTINRLFRYGMVSLGQYVVDCCLTTGSKVFNSTFGHRNSSHEYERIRNQGQRRKLLNFEELRMQDNDLYCPKREYPEDRCKDSSNNSATQFSSKRKEVETIEENDECFCGNSRTQFSRKNKGKNRLRAKRTFNGNDDRYLCDCGFQDQNYERDNEKREVFDVGCGISALLNKLFCTDEQNSNSKNAYKTRKKHYVGGGGMFGFLHNPYIGSNNACSYNENDSDVFCISTGCTHDNAFHMSETIYKPRYSESVHQSGCDNISFQTELAHSVERNSGRTTSKLFNEQNNSISHDNEDNLSSRQSIKPISECSDHDSASLSAICNLPVSLYLLQNYYT